MFFAITADDIPEIGRTVNASVYRGDHASEGEAANAAAAAFQVASGTRMWVGTAGSLTRYIVAASRTATATAG